MFYLCQEILKFFKLFYNRLFINTLGESLLVRWTRLKPSVNQLEYIYGISMQGTRGAEHRSQFGGRWKRGPFVERRKFVTPSDAHVAIAEVPLGAAAPLANEIVV